MRLAQAFYKDTANRRQAPAPNYQVGDKVYLDIYNLQLGRLLRKLFNKY